MADDRTVDNLDMEIEDLREQLARAAIERQAAVLAERARCAAIARDTIYCDVTNGVAGILIAEEIERG